MNYRKEIDGLRAVAVLPVILFHAGFQAFSGGFVGVDVFFVISGYLITSIILAEKQAGTFSLANFYERRARRILPPLFVVMFACLPFAWLWLLPVDKVKFSQSLVAVSIFASNFHFYSQYGYFETVAALKPLLHTWSLAVEEQYYLVFPIFLLLTWRLGKRWIIAMLAVVAIISLSAAHWGSLNNHQEFTFYLLPTRGWEILVGAFIAFFPFKIDSDKTASKGITQSFSIVGVLLITYAVCSFDKQTPFPSLYALIPTIGAALIILFATQQTIVGKLLGSKLLVGVGLISYSAYLWHQPLFVFARYLSIDEPSKVLLTVLAVAAILLAYLSWKFIETPFRNKQLINRNQVLLFSALCSLMFVAIGLVGHLMDGFNKLPKYSKYDDFWSPTIECFYPTKGYKNILCDKELFRIDGGRSILFIGDSLLSSSAEGIYKAADELGIRVNIAPRWRCPAIQGVIVNEEYNVPVYKGCLEFNKVIFDFILREKVTHVILFSAFSDYLRNGLAGLGETGKKCSTKEACIVEFGSAIKNTADFFRKNNINYYFVKQPPDFSRLVPKDINRFALHNGVNTITMPRSLYDSDSMAFGNLLASTGNVISFEDIFCNKNSCSPAIQDEMYYVDGAHFGRKGAMKLSSFWRQQLSNILETH